MRPNIPEDIEGEARLEWARVCDELAEAGRLKQTDRALVHLWCVTWAVWHSVTRHVDKYGPILPAHNHVIGKSPWYAVQRETANALAKLAEQMGLSCSSRNFDRKASDEPADLSLE